MAESTSLILVFEGVTGNSIMFSFPYIKPSVTSAHVKTLMDTMITNCGIFSLRPTEKVRAYTVTTSQTEIDLS